VGRELGAGVSRDFLLPDLGEGLTEAEVLRWLVAVGETITVDQPVVEVETAKAAVEVPSPYAGVVVSLHGQAGDVLEVGKPLITVQEEGFHEPGAVTAGSGNVLIGYGTSEPRPTRRGTRHRRADRSPTQQPRALNPAGGPVPVVSPLVRRLAREKGLDLRAITGSGPDGLVLRRDVEAAGPERVTAGGVTRVPMTMLRRTIAANLARSRREIPEATVWVDVDVTDLMALRSDLAGRPGGAVSVLALLARFVIAGLVRYPDLNARVDVEGDAVLRHHDINLGFAAQTPRGLVVPVISRAQDLNARALHAQIGDLAAQGRQGSLPPERMTGGTFTVNNYGVFGVDGSAAIINHPEVAILGIGRILDRPWVVDGSLTVRKVTELTLAFDHRVCDGEVAGGFLRFVADCLERPAALVAEL
jgi:2-oxoisovalerate dehydrogenase E2 component (dihydrolipoyl transacylase)